MMSVRKFQFLSLKVLHAVLAIALASAMVVVAKAAPEQVSPATAAAADQAITNSYMVAPDKVQELLRKERYIERQIKVRQKNASERKDASAQQYNLGYEDGYNKALLDLLKSQLLNGIKLPQAAPSNVTPAMQPTLVPTLPAITGSSSPSSRPPIDAPRQSSNASVQTGTPASNPSRMTAPAAASGSVPSLLPSAATAAAAGALRAGSSAASIRASGSAPKATSQPLATPAQSAAQANTATNQQAVNSNRVFPGKSVPIVNPTTAAKTASAAPAMAGAQSDSFKQYMTLSTQALQNKQWKQAAEYAGRAISIKNDVASAYINRSWALAELGDTRQALVDANLAIQLEPELGLAYNNRAYTYELMNNLVEARNDYQRACQRNFRVACSVLPKIDKVLADRVGAKRANLRQLKSKSEALVRQRDWPEVIKISTQIINIDANQASAYINRAWARAETGNLEASLADAGKAIIIHPNDPIAYNNRAYTYELMNDLDSARRDYAKACQLKLASACNVVAKIDALNKAQPKKVTQSQLAKPKSKQQKVQQLISVSFEKFRQGNWSAVEQLSNKILKIDPNNALAYVNRAGARTEMGLMYNALDDIEKAIRLNPRLGIAYNNKAYTLERMGAKQKAMIQYQKACQLGLQQSCKDFKRLKKRP